jgi:hypothetical protein
MPDSKTRVVRFSDGNFQVMTARWNGAKWEASWGKGIASVEVNGGLDQWLENCEAMEAGFDRDEKLFLEWVQERKARE